MSATGQEIGHVRGMSAELSTTEVGVPIGDIGSSNGPRSPARAVGGRHRRGAETGRRVVDLQCAKLRPAARRHAQHPQRPIVGSAEIVPPLRRPRAGAGRGAENAFE
jgi:hypothetical protein